MNAVPNSHRSAEASIRRVRRLAHLEAVLADCRTLLRQLPAHCAEAQGIAMRIVRAQDEIDRLRGMDAPTAAPEALQQDLEAELASWKGNRDGG